jgi:hypothetical protein
MIRKFKALGLATVAVLAMSAVVASAASAQFTANSYPTTVTATSALGNDVLTIDGTSQECQSHFQGTFSEETTALTITPIYSGCKFFGFASGTIAMNGCDYVFHSNGSFDVECPAGKVITYTAGNCEAQIGTQTGLKSIILTSNPPHVDARFSITGMTVNVTKDGFLCPLTGTGHKTATYSQGSAMTVKPISGGTSIDIR